MNKYLPFVAHCDCGYEMDPLNHPDYYTTICHPRHTIPIVFWCDSCSHTETYTYQLPILRDDVSKNLVQHLKKTLTLSDSLLIDRITLSESNLIAQKGLRWAIADLQQKNVLHDADGLSFYLTLLGCLLLWHGPY